MAHRDDAGGSPWTVLKALGVALAALAMVGFGSCGLLVVAIGSSLGEDDATLVLLGLGLIAVAVGALVAMLKIIKSTRER